MISNEERAIYEKMQLPIVIYDYNNEKMHAELISDGLCSVANKERQAFLNQLNSDIYYQVHPDDKAWVKRDLESFFHKLKDFDVVFRNTINNLGGYRMIHAIGKWQEMADGSEMAFISYYDMLDPEEKIGRLFSYGEHNESDIIYKDVITGLPNLNYLRQFSIERLQSIRACDKEPVLIYVDVKNLHDYNTQYGYARGDDVIRLIAGLIRGRFPGALVTRAADDHFIIIDDYKDDDYIIQRIEMINNEAKSMAYGKIQGVHVGICKMGNTMDAAKAADYAKQTLKDIKDDLNTVWRFYTDDQDERFFKQRHIFENLEVAIEKGWIKPFYQEIVRTKTGKTTIFESLARWMDPIVGMISPADFIPVYAHYHVIHKLDLYMVEQVCLDIEKRKQAGFPCIPVTVNFSAQDFDYIDVTAELNNILEKHGVDHEKIIVEVTEQDLAKGSDDFKNQLNNIRANGYKLWIDDFGSGYSSLSVFSQFTIDRIKFDMDLLRHWNDNNGANRLIMKAFVGLCREMRISTLSEGVETKEQYEFLQEIGCDLAQGYYFCKPEPIEATLFRFSSKNMEEACETLEERRENNKKWFEDA